MGLESSNPRLSAANYKVLEKGYVSVFLGGHIDVKNVLRKEPAWSIRGMYGAATGGSGGGNGGESRLEVKNKTKDQNHFLRGPSQTTKR